MYLFTRLFQAARAWRNGGRPKNAKRSAVAVEQLDHRQLLSVNFSGNVATDFTPTITPTPQFPSGVVLFNSSNTPGIIHPNTAFYGNLIGTSGYDISGIAVNYDSADDTLSIGFEQPPSGKPGQPGPVIAGDADNNGNAGNVNPAVTAIDFGFTEYPALEGSGTEMNAFLDLAATGTPDVVAGFSPIQPPLPADQSSTGPNPQAPKPYQVAQAIPATEPFTGPTFGTLLPNNTGNVYLANLTAHPNLEFSIANFSQLYLAETGHALTPSSVIGVGAFAGNNSTAHINDAFFPLNYFTLAQATAPVPPVNNNPEPSPPILINPHEHRIIDTGHRDLIRVSIFGTSGFPVKNINPATVELEGVASIAHITRKIQRDEFPFQTYVFVADQLSLPPGLTTATLTGETFSGVKFESQKDVLNLPHSALAFGRLKKYMGNASYYKRLAKIEAQDPGIANTSAATTVSLASRNAKADGAAKIVVDYTPRVSAAGGAAKAETVKVRPVVSLKRSEKVDDKSTVPTRVRYSMEHHLSAAG